MYCCVLLGYVVDLEEDAISSPAPKIIGATNLIQSPEFNTGCRTLTLQSVQELRGCINHWSKTWRVWNWLTEPANQMIDCTDSAHIWTRRHDWEKWHAFWAVIQFIRDLSSGRALWRTLFTGRFSELVGLHREATPPPLLVPTSGFPEMRHQRSLVGSIGPRRNILS